MKIAISVPDVVSRAADQAARRMRVPRSQFYVRAVRAYLRQAAEREVTERLDAVHGGREDEEPDPFLRAAAKSTFGRSRW